jgi:hypothetical protein
MITSIMQPTFLPGLSFFSLIIQSDNFVFLDNVKFQKQSWQQRNQILINDKKNWIIVPVKKSEKKQINQITILDENIHKVILKTIKQNYCKTKFFNEYWESFEDIFIKSCNTKNLSILNISIIKWICEKLKIDCNFSNSSSYDNSQSKIERLISINKKLNTSIYLSPIGSYDYLSEAESKFTKQNIDLVFNNYDEIKSVNENNKLNLSIIDLLFNCGFSSKKIISKGVGKPYNSSEINKINT